MYRCSLVPTLLLATKKDMLPNTDLRLYGHYHSCQITKLVKGLGENQNTTHKPHFNPNHFANLFVGLFCKPTIPMQVRG